MVEGIEKIYYIVHPAYTLANFGKKSAKTPVAAMQRFIEDRILPVVEEAKRDPSAIVVFIRSPVETFRIKGGASLERIPRHPSGARKMRAIEKKLEGIILQKMGNRAIIPKMEREELYCSEYWTANEAIKIINERKLLFARRFEVMGYGSLREACAKNFSRQFAEQAQGHRIGYIAGDSVVTEGTISIKERDTKLAEYHRKQIPGLIRPRPKKRTHSLIRK